MALGIVADAGYLLALVENTKIYVNNEVAAWCGLITSAFFLGMTFFWALPVIWFHRCLGLTGQTKTTGWSIACLKNREDVFSW